MSKVLITGGAGFIGSHLADQLITQGSEVVVIDDLSSGKRENLNPEAGFFEADIADYEKILPLFASVEYVFHLAALPSVQYSVEQPRQSHQTNVDGLLNCLQAAKAHGVKKFIYSSSCSVYGNQVSLPLIETMKPEPLSPYALQKLIGEFYCQLYSRLYQLPTVSLRYFNVYGPRQSGSGAYANAMAKFIQLKKEGRPLTIFGDGEQTRDFVYVSDVVEVNIAAMTNTKVSQGEIINICSGKNHSVNYIANLIGGERLYLEARPGEPRDALGDNTLAGQLLNWKPKVLLEKGIKNLLTHDK